MRMVVYSEKDTQIIMNVIIVLGAISIGGAQRVAFNLSESLNRESDCHTTIVSLSQTKGEKYDTTGHDVVELRGKNTIGQLREFVKTRQPDIVLTMTVPLSIYTVPALVGLKVKHIISERTAPSRSATKGVTRVLSRLLMRMADGYVFQTEEARDFYGGKIAKNSVVIPNPLFNLTQMPLTQFSGEDPKTIVTAGRLNEVKNHQMLIKAFKDISEKYPDYKLIIYGSGPEKERDEELVEELGLKERAILPGATKKIVEAIYKASMFVLTSNYEGMPNALMEAMALGLPCISTDCPSGGPKELIQDKINGLLIPVEDKDALSSAIRYLIENPQKAKAMGLQAMSIRESHSMERICKHWFDFFKQLI